MVLAFLRDTKVGEVVPLAALGGGGDGPSGRGRREGGRRNPHENALFLCLFLSGPLSLFSFFSILSFRGFW